MEDPPYIPGLTPRPPDGAWDTVRALALVPTATSTASANSAWQTGLDLIARGYWWEAHEVLEQVWMNAPANAPERRVVQAVIQIANGALKIRMDRPWAARRLARIACDLIGEVREDDRLMGLARDRLLGAARAVEAAARTGEPPELDLR